MTGENIVTGEMPPRLTRRALLRVGAAALAPIVLYPLLSRELVFRSSLRERIAGLLPHAGAAAVVGAAFLRAHPQTSAEGLIDDISRNLGLNPNRLERLSDSELGFLLDRRIRDDFQGRRTVVVDGWILAETEARLAAVVALGA